ncbi:MAG: alkaline phosphatase D family protein [Planctomycetota bacterium]
MRRSLVARTLLPVAAVALTGALVVPGCTILGVEPGAPRAVFAADWADRKDRRWIGERHWANRLQDWRLVDGGVECLEARPRFGVRTLHLLTHWLNPGGEGSFRSVVKIEAASGDRDGSAAGFLFGAGGDDVDFRISSQVHGTPAEDGGFLALVDGAGRATILDFETPVPGSGGQWAARTNHDLAAFTVPDGIVQKGEGFPGGRPAPVELELVGARFDGRRTLTLSVRDEDGIVLSTAEWLDPPEAAFDGAVALVSHRGPAGSQRGYRFEDWSLAGELVEADPGRSFGPIAFVHYTVDESEGTDDATLRMTAQSVPLGRFDTLVASLEIATRRRRFVQEASATFEPRGAVFRFRVDGLDARRSYPFRIRYVPLDPLGRPDATRTALYEGIIAARPTDDAMTIAVLNCQKSYTGDLRWNESGIWFPHAEVAENVALHDPDLLYFAGDQIYEGDLTPAIRQPPIDAALDYAHKWYRHGWSFGELTRRLPAVVVPDDHDVYHGNIWGNAGVALDGPEDLTKQDRGGYVMPPDFVLTVHNTQVSHLPPPQGASRLANGISTYHTTLDWGGGSFAILGDRMYKSPPAVLVPEGEVRNGWFRNPDFDPVTQSDVPGAVLLGEVQHDVLRRWGTTWREPVWFKACLSQSPFANVATIPEEATSGSIIPSLEVPEPGVYVQGDKRAADMDSNGWPRSGRDVAVSLLRAAGAFHLTGDQHLGSTLRYGVEQFDDAGYVLSSPAVANTWPRRWFPDPTERVDGGDQPQAAPGYTGRYRDGFGNAMTVLAVANPRSGEVEPKRLHDRAPGYGIARVDRAAGTLTFEAWPRHVDPSAPDAAPYLGWPVTVPLDGADGRTPLGWLPELTLDGPAIVEVVAEGPEPEVVYTRRVEDGVARLPIFDEEVSYAIRVARPGHVAGDAWPWERVGLRPSRAPADSRIAVDLDGGEPDGSR